MSGGRCQQFTDRKQTYRNGKELAHEGGIYYRPMFPTSHLLGGAQEICGAETYERAAISATILLIIVNVGAPSRQAQTTL